jgi:hypothetical protein
VRVRTATHDRAELEVDYEGGITQLASVDLVWPEAIEDFLEPAGLELELMRGHDEGDLEDSASFFVLARPSGSQPPPASRLRSDQTPST